MNALTARAFFTSLLEDRRQRQSSLEVSFRQAQKLAGVLDSHKSHHHGALSHLMAVSDEVVSQVEDYGAQLAQQKIEPAYHNRQHFADALLALGAFLQLAPQIPVDQKQLMLLTILVHDFGHRGLGHQDAAISHEAISVKLLSTTAINQLSQAEQARISQWILGTNTSQLALVNSQHLMHPDNQAYLMQSLINDADIATSFISSLAHPLTRLILQELGAKNPSDDAIDKAYLSFRSQYFITTSIAKTYLGL